MSTMTEMVQTLGTVERYVQVFFQTELGHLPIHSSFSPWP